MFSSIIDDLRSILKILLAVPGLVSAVISLFYKLLKFLSEINTDSTNKIER